MAAFPFTDTPGVCPHCGRRDGVQQIVDERRSCSHCGARWHGRRDARTGGPLSLDPLSPIPGTAVAAPAPARSRASEMLDEFQTHPNSIGHGGTNGMALRRALTIEEHEELIEALDQGDPAKIARELADVVYVAYGTAWAYGIDLDAALIEIHRAAMDKIRAGHRRADGKILKPPGFVPPDMTAAVRGVPPIDTAEAA